MSNTRKYYLSQLLAIPLVALPTLIGGLLLGGFLTNMFKIDTGIFTGGVSFACMLGLGWIAARVTGIILCRIGLLPRGAHRIYPQARSWREYEGEHLPVPR
jgi:hypothetical protein